jgi:hypothetical protein
MVDDDVGRRVRIALVLLGLLLCGGPSCLRSGFPDEAPVDADGAGTLDNGSSCPAAPTGGLIAYFKLDESDGTVAADSAGGAPGTLANGPLWRPAGGRIGGALELDGVDDHVQVDQQFKGALSSFSVAVWVRARGSLTESLPLVTALNGHGLYPRVWILASGKMMFQLGIDGTPRADSIRPAIPIDVWQQIVVTFDHQAGNAYTCYLNGVKQGEEDFPDGEVDGGDQPMLIGRDRSPVVYYEGLLDDLRVYDRALEEAEVKDLFDAAGCQE